MLIVMSSVTLVSYSIVYMHTTGTRVKSLFRALKSVLY